MPHHHAVGLIAIALVLSACGDFVRYDRDAPGSTADAGAALDCPFTPASTELDYAAYDALLTEVVAVDAAGDARVDYAVLDADGRPALEALLLVMACVEPRAGDLAFWINAYNASVLRAVLEARALDSDFRPDAGDFAIFKQRKHRLAGLLLTLDEIEHAIIRGQPRDPSPHVDALDGLHRELWGEDRVDARIHMALNCAARSCPNLRAVAYTPEGLEAHLSEATRAFLDNDEKGAGPGGISSLFDWFEGDFAASAGSVDAFIEQWRSDGLEGVDTSTFLEYDWALNAR